MREQPVDFHKVPGGNDNLEVTVHDLPGAGNANHLYSINGFNINQNPSLGHIMDVDSVDLIIAFQNGAIDPNVGKNGVTIESLLAVCKHRLEGFQSGPFACSENQVALDGITAALESLKSRTAKRIAQQVEGKELNHKS